MNRTDHASLGELCVIAPRSALCRIYDLSSLAVPLAVTEPAGISIEAWAVANMTGDTSAARIQHVLVLHGAGIDALTKSKKLSLDTHFAPIALSLTPIESAEFQTYERALITRAILYGLASGAAFRPDLFSYVSDDLRDLVASDDAGEVVELRTSEHSITLTGKFLPESVILDLDTKPALHRVAQVVRRFGMRDDIELILDRKPTPPVIGRDAILLGQGTYRIGRFTDGSRA